jgi:hypothetical protein
MTVPDFQQAWHDPNNRPKLRKMRAIYDPAHQRVIEFQRHLKARYADPKSLPTPIDIHGYADKHAGAMLRIVPEIHGLAPVNVETVNPEKGGQVEIIPAGILVEQQVRYPSHQWDNEILPLLLDDPTAEIDIEGGRIVLRGKNNLARNLFLDRDRN